MNKDVIYSNKALDGSENFGVIYLRFMRLFQVINLMKYISLINKWVKR